MHIYQTCDNAGSNVCIGQGDYYGVCYCGTLIHGDFCLLVYFSYDSRFHANSFVYAAACILITNLEHFYFQKPTNDKAAEAY